MKSLLKTAISLNIGSEITAAWGSLSQLEHGKFHEAFAGNGTNSKTIFDLASLTKILATTSLYLKWVDSGIIDLQMFYPGKTFTFHQLLTHSSGLPAWKPFYESMKAKYGNATQLRAVPVSERKNYFYDLVLAENLENEPGKKIVYSDLGFILLARYAEQLRGKSFDQIVQEEVWDLIPNCRLHYRPISASPDTVTGVVPTEDCPWRGLLTGEVHDDNCWSSGGVSGHAGVFGSLSDLLAWIHAFITGGIASFQTLQRFTQIQTDLVGARRAVGFDVPSVDGSGSTGFVFSVNSIGHLGFTGTSLWMDLDENKFAVLLTNRVHPSRNDNRIRDLRKAFHQVAFMQGIAIS